jgi:tryptophan synthase alpha chain
VAVGFGIRTPDSAAAVARVADAAVVGSALVDELAGALDAPPIVDTTGANKNVTSRVLSKAADLAQAVRFARVDDGRSA